MLPEVSVPGTTFRTTVLGFGCADIFRAPSARERMRLLIAAFDSGIRHFDVAPMYGLGLAEMELGRFAKGRRQDISIATKFGIAPTALARGISIVQGPVRWLLNVAPTLRRGIRSQAAGPSSGRAGAALYQNVGYSRRAAQQGLERSLRALATDYIDLLLLHDPSPDDVRYEELFEYLEQARDAGLIRAWGVAGEPFPSLEATARFPRPVPVVQLRNDIFLRSLEHVPPDLAHGYITYGVLGRAIPRLLSYLATHPDRRRSWNDSLGIDCGEPENLARMLLQEQVHRGHTGVVLFSTIRQDKIRSAVSAAESASQVPAETLDAFRTMVAAELPSVRAHVEVA